MAVKNSILAIPSITFNSATMNPLAYQPINLGGIPYACFEIILSNFSSQAIIYSFDGETDHGQMIPDQVLILRGGSGASQPNTNAAVWTKGLTVYVRGTAGVGPVVLSGLYQNQGA